MRYNPPPDHHKADGQLYVFYHATIDCGTFHDWLMDHAAQSHGLGSFRGAIPIDFGGRREGPMKTPQRRYNVLGCRQFFPACSPFEVEDTS